MLATTTYQQRRDRLRTYFDETAVEAWEQLTSNAPLGRIRETVRRGRAQMRSLLLAQLPDDLDGASLLDAGCGTGAMAFAAAARGARVHGVELSPRLVELAHARAPDSLSDAALEFTVGDMLDPALGVFDHVVCMDSLIHYGSNDILDALAQLAYRTHRSILFTIAPRTPLLGLMHALGRLFPRTDRAPAIEPLRVARLIALLSIDQRFIDWRMRRVGRVNSGFYISEGLVLERRCK